MIEGAISHIAFAGGWFARKSPPYTVSSKCSQVESPSPLVLTAPLMPPCAQTECERLTGTTEKRSTECPPSAIFMAAANPARPPPTIAILIPLVAAAISVKETSPQAARMHKSRQGVDAYGQKRHAESYAGIAGQTLRARANRDAPVNQKQPDAVGEVPDGRRDSDDVDGENPGLTKLALDDRECLVRMMRDRSAVSLQARNDAEAHIQHVKGDEEEENHARDALNRVEPVARVRVRQIVRTRFPRNDQAVDGVIDQRNEDEEDFDQQDIGNTLQGCDRFVEVANARVRVDRFRVGVKMFQQKCAERHNT